MEWSPQDRDAFIEKALTSADKKGFNGPYSFSVYPASASVMQHDAKKINITDCLAKTIYHSSPQFKKISLKFYEILLQKMSTHCVLGAHMFTNIFLLIKGSNAYPYLLKKHSDFTCSDLDIIIYISPELDDDTFEMLAQNAKILVLQTISQYKRTLDHMFFLNNKQTSNAFLSDDDIAEFKKAFTEAVHALPTEQNQLIMSPFESDTIRNASSRNSFMISNSKSQEDSVVKIEVPHFNKCERIPLRKTPLFCSYNDTISFKRDADTLEGHFDLYRIRFNCLLVEADENGNVVKDERLSADFIDVSIASKDDAELADFWEKGQCLSIHDKDANIWLNIPNLDTCIHDLYKMLNVYSCPESKRPKREARYNALLSLRSGKLIV